jgi:AsmA protein
VTAPTGYLRLGLVFAAVLAVGIGALITVSLLIPADTVRSAVTAEIRAVTGLEPVIRGEASVSLFPSATVTFTDVSLGEERSDRPALAAERLTANLRLLPLLIGRIETADVSLMRPRVTVVVDKDGRSNWSALIETLARTLEPAAKVEHVMSFSEIRMSDGVVMIRDEARGISETLSNVELSLAWPSISRSFGATGRFVWRGQPVDGSASLGDLLAALSGQRSSLKVRLAGDPFKLAFDGHLSNRPTLKIEGTLAADGASLRRAMQWAGYEPLPGGGFGRFALKAQASALAGSFSLSAVNMELDGNVAEGVLSLTTSGRSTIKGTLASETLDLTPYISTVQLMRTNERVWNRGQISLEGLSSFDLDLRLSAANITVANAKLGRTGVAANLREGSLTVTVGEAQAFGGILKGSITLAQARDDAEVKSQLQFTNVDLETCLGELFGIRRLEGKGDLTFALDAAGDSIFELTRTISGTAGLTARQGAITGINVEQLLKRLEQKPLSGAAEFRRGRTTYSKLNVLLRFENGTATIEEVRLEGTGVRLALGGSASIPSRDLDLKGTASLVPASTDAGQAFELPFVVQGPWDDPIMLPDAQSLIQRSQPAQQLLRDYKDKEAVRSAIDRLRREGITIPGLPQLPDPGTARSQ